MPVGVVPEYESYVLRLGGSGDSNIRYTLELPAANRGSVAAAAAAAAAAVQWRPLRLRHRGLMRKFIYQEEIMLSICHISDCAHP